MTEPVCFKCGHGKTWVLSQCKQCGSIPLTEDELSLSLVLCKHLSSELAHFHEIKNDLRMTTPESLFAQAREALKDPQLMAMFGVKRQAVQTPATAARDTQRPANSQQASHTTSPRRRS